MGFEETRKENVLVRTARPFTSSSPVVDRVHMTMEIGRLA